MITIDGVVFDVPVISIDQTGEFLDKRATRTQDGKLHREIIGVYYNYQLVFGRDATTTALAALWDKLTEPVEFHTVIVPDADGAPFEFSAYFAGVKRSLRRDTPTKTFWKDLTVNFIAEEPARIPA